MHPFPTFTICFYLTKYSISVRICWLKIFLKEHFHCGRQAVCSPTFCQHWRYAQQSSSNKTHHRLFSFSELHVRQSHLIWWIISQVCWRASANTVVKFKFPNRFIEVQNYSINAWTLKQLMNIPTSHDLYRHSVGCSLFSDGWQPWSIN